MVERHCMRFFPLKSFLTPYYRYLLRRLAVWVSRGWLPRALLSASPTPACQRSLWPRLPELQLSSAPVKIRLLYSQCSVPALLLCLCHSTCAILHCSCYCRPRYMLGKTPLYVPFCPFIDFYLLVYKICLYFICRIIILNVMQICTAADDKTAI